MRYKKTQALTTERIAHALAPFGKGLSSGQLAAIRAYIETLLLWNEKISLTSTDDPLEVVRRHFGESIYIGNIADLSFGRLADVGTGAGFPGLALKIVFPELQVALIEPNSKKCAFLNEIIDKLGLKYVEVVRRPYAEIEPNLAGGFRNGETASPVDGTFNFVCSRALGSYKDLLHWARNALVPGGIVILWVGREDSSRIGRTPGWRWRAPVMLPESEKRMIRIGEPTEEVDSGRE